MTTIAVLGGGSLGLLLAGKLKASGCSCVLWTRTDSQAALVNSVGITIEDHTGNSLNSVTIHACSLEEVTSSDNRVVLLAVKQTALTSELLTKLASIIPVGGALVLFQNGVGHVELLEQALPGRRLIVAVTTEGAHRLDATTVRHTGHGETRLSDNSDIDPHLLSFLEQSLKQAGFSAFLSKELGEAILRKLLINAIINPLTAIMRIRNGELTKSAARLELMKALFDETLDILRDYGLGKQSEAELWDTVLNVCSATSHNESSMLQDVVLHKETEIEYINGAICRIATQQGKQAPWNEAVTALIKAIN
ncbi:ketopantoate reductase family protein [Cohnella abietis]|uniref:2-dehydropantoate 2-reductase n=1 Tax=Cohnella abietis TaxID=2507935 RepID=A0A3T1D9C9_9BACL|nr:2-dehydropantoate 2-reductase [Cohnella abietis]BBI34690.1 2-dehydropantoate 2-reductase [Cohnella abietis]